MELDQDKLNALLGRLVGEMGAIASGPLVLLGDRLGLYKAMAGAGPMTVDDLSAKTGLRLRYAQEWLNAQAANGFVDYEPQRQTYTLGPEAAEALANDGSPANLMGGYQVLSALYLDLYKLERAYRSGSGLGWQEHDPLGFEGTERFFRVGYNTHLVPGWIPALDGVEAKLKAGAQVADVGCGYGTSTIVMAKAYPQSRFVGYDFHPPSIEAARAAAAREGVADRVRFEHARAKDYPGSGFDLVAFFDCLHDMGDPIGAAAHVRQSLAPGGTWMLVEPYANDRVEDNLNPVGRVYYNASAQICVPCSLAQEVGLGLGAQAGESRIRQVVSDGGFKRFRRAAETPFNIVYEARA